jgi:chromosome segregation ATPase
MNTLRRWRSALIISIATIALFIFGSYRGATLPPANSTAEAQDLTGIERRISLLEQRFYSVETSINRLEQQTRLTPGTASSQERTIEINLLRSEVETLQRRLAEAECGLLKLDERTLSPAARQARQRASGTDPCRLSADSPVKLSARP